MLDKKDLDFIKTFLEFRDTNWVQITARGDDGIREMVMPIGKKLEEEPKEEVK